MMSLRGALFALALGCMAGVTGSAPVQAAQFSADQTTEIQGIIKSYLMAHPELDG